MSVKYSLSAPTFGSMDMQLSFNTTNKFVVLPIFFAFVIIRDRHSQCSRNGSGRMTYAKSIVFAFRAFRKTGDPTFQTVGMKNIAATGKYFVSVCLMANIPNKLIIRGIENIMEGNGHKIL